TIDDFGEWGDLGTNDDDLFAEDSRSDDNNDLGWSLNEVEDGDIFADEPLTDTASSDDIGLPDWLADMPVPGEDDPIIEEPIDELPAEDALDWLEDMPVPGENVQAFNLDELGDDWLDAVDDEIAQPVLDDEALGVPDWLVDSEVDEGVATPDDDLFDLFDDSEIVAETAGDDLSDLLGDFDTDDSDDLGDLLASLDTGDNDGSLDDLLASLDVGEGDEDANLDDLFASLEDDTSEEDAVLDDLFASIDESADDLDFLGDMDDSSDDLDFLGDMDDSSDDLDFLGDIDDEAQAEYDSLDEVDPEPVKTTNYLADLFGEDEDDAPDLELDSKDDIELELVPEPEPEPTDGFSFFDDLDIEPVDNVDDIEPIADDLVTSSSALNFLSDDIDSEDELSSDLDFLENTASQEDDLPDTGTLLGGLFDDSLAVELPDTGVLSLDFNFDDTQDQIPDTGSLYEARYESTPSEPVANDTELSDTDDLLGGLFDADTEDVEDNSFDFDFEANEIDAELSDTDELLGGLFDVDTEDVEGDSFDFDFEANEIDADDEVIPSTGSLAYIDNIPADEGDEPDWLDEISGIDTDTLDQATPTNKRERVDIDALIDSFEDSADPIYDTANDDLEAGVNLDTFFDQMDSDDQAIQSDDLPAEAMPNWLQEIAQSGDSESAASLLRERQNRSLDDLDDRLLDLRERGLEISSNKGADVPADQARLSKIIPNIDEALVPASMTPGQSAIITEPTITTQQAQNAAILQGLVGSIGLDTTADDAATSSNVGKTLLDNIVARADRLVIAGILIIAVMLPFVYPAFGTISILPPNEFADDSPEFAAFTVIENLNANDYVLIGAEYGAAGARELDTATRSIMEHIIINGGIPVIISSDAVGLLRTENIAVELLGEDVRNVGYYVAGLIPGGNVGLRDFSVNLQAFVSTDLRGNPIDLDIDSLDDFAAIILISESGESVRNWMEQIAPVTNSDIIVVTGQSARPIALPYVDSVDNVVAMLTSYDDAYTYQQMSLALYNPSETPIPSATLSPTPTITPMPTLTSTATHTALPTATNLPATATDMPPTATDIPPTATDMPATDLPATDVPTEVVDAQAATDEEEATETPTETVVPTNTTSPETDADTLIDVAVVNAESNANVRSGAGTGFAIVGSVASGDNLAIIDRSVDDDWVQIVLPDGNTAWIATILIDEIQVPSSEFDGLTDASTTATVEIGTVNSDARVNIRAGAGSNFAAVAGLDPNTRVRVIGISADGDWYLIALPNGGEGWIAAFLLIIEEIPASDWDGARKDGFFPIYFSPPVSRVAQNEDEIIVGRNASGITVPVYEDDTRTTVLAELDNGAEFIVIEDGDTLTQILLEDGRIGFIETRLIVTSIRQRDEVDFAPTLTPTLAPTATLTPSPSPTATPILPQITPMPFTDPQTRSSSQALGLLLAIVVIALGNLFWILRWLGQRDK
ncbi:MAG: SH3 domain-containing protein, partial [Phototrophicaceae bacterium]